MREGTYTRRGLIASSVVGGMVFVSGCLGDGDADDGDDIGGADTDDTDDANDTDDAGQDGDEIEEIPIDPREDDFADRTGMDEIEVITRDGEGTEPDFVFDPPFVAVDPGTTIRWVNEDDVFHTVTSTPDLEDRQGGGELFDEDIAEAGDTFEWTVDEPGIYHYYCQPHVGFMWGAIAVLDDGVFPDEDSVDDTGEDDQMDDTDDEPADDPDEDTDEDPVDDEEYTDVPEELPTDPDDDDFIDVTGQDEAEVYTRQGREDEPNFVFDPPFIRVDQGTTVRWVNTDGVFHTVTSTDSLANRSGGGSEFDATISAEGDEFTWDADEQGRQDYYCSPHAGFMFGSIDIV